MFDQLRERARTRRLEANREKAISALEPYNGDLQYAATRATERADNAQRCQVKHDTSNNLLAAIKAKRQLANDLTIIKDFTYKSIKDDTAVKLAFNRLKYHHERNCGYNNKTIIKITDLIRNNSDIYTYYKSE